MKKRLELLSFVATVAAVFALGSWVLTSWNGNSLGTVAQAQQNPNSQQTPSEPPPQNQAPPQAQPGQTQPGQAQPGQSQPPDQTQQSAPTDGHEFVGTIVKQGNKYMFQDAGSGQMYDIDHQDQVSKFDGKKVRVRGTLDPQTKTIHVQ